MGTMTLRDLTIAFLTLLSVTAALPQEPSSTGSKTILGPDEDGKYTIRAEGVRAQFIPYGASITNLFIKDINGIERDIVLGWDNATYYSEDKSHPHLGGVPGRYANRIKNSTFEIDGEEYHVIPNENDGKDTLHGGPNGWDWRNFTVESHTKDTIVFSIVDPDGEQGFPGEVISYITYNVEPYTWNIKMIAEATTKKTPIMLSSHTYWNLDGFQNPDTGTALNHSLYMPYSGLRVGTDGILIPNGTLLPNLPGSVNDFWSEPKQIGKDFNEPEIVGNCGTNCIGYDTCYLVSREQDVPYDWRVSGPIATLSSAFSGITVEIFTDQDAFQIYSCGGQNGSMPVKKTQGFFDDATRPRTVPKYGCVVMEVEDWIDGINQPEWMRQKKQIFGPDTDPYVLQVIHKFSVGGGDDDGDDEKK